MLDTSVLIAGLAPKMIETIEEYCSSAICRAELARGLWVAEKDPAQHLQTNARRELLRLLDAIPGFWLDFDRAAADGYAQLATDALRREDALIAGHAISRGLTLITADRSFTRFPGLSLEVAGAGDAA